MNKIINEQSALIISKITISGAKKTTIPEKKITRKV